MISARVFRALLAFIVVAIAGCAAHGEGAGRSDFEPTSKCTPTPFPVLGVATASSAARSDPEGSTAATRSPASQAIQDGPVAIRAALSRATYGNSYPQCLLLKVDYFATAKAQVERPPLNISLVLDRSASMAEGRKFPYTIQAARWVVENMTERDVLSIVAFNDQATVLSAAGRVVNKPFLYHRLEEISPQGYTNLSAGLLEGIAQVNSSSAKGQVKQVFLLTDGLANRGATGPAALRKIVEQAKAEAIGVSTMGVGTEFNETLLADMATAGSGRYAYIKTPEQIPTAFKDELRGLLQVVVQNAMIEVTVAGGEIGKVYGQLLVQRTLPYKLVIGDLRVTERGFFLTEIKPAGFDNGAILQVEARLVFDDPQVGGRVSRVARVRASFAAEPGPGDLREDQGIVILAAVLNALEQADAAAQGLDTERYRQAKTSFEQLYERAREHAIRNRDQELLNQVFVLKHFMGELAAAEKEGLLHGHREAQERLKKESHYLRYLLTHHRPQP